MRLNHLVVSFFFLFNSCSTKEGNEQLQNFEYSIDPMTGHEVKISQFVTDFDIVHLNEEEIVGFVSDLIVYDDKIIVIDTQQLRKIQVFDNSGKHLFSINSEGEGPGEFKVPSIVRVSSSGEHLLVYDGLTKKFMKFDWSGNFIEEISFRKAGLVGDFIEKNDEIIFLNVMTIDPSKRIGKFNWGKYSDDKEIVFFENYPADFIKIIASKGGYFFKSMDENLFYFIDHFSEKLVSMNWDGFKDVYRFNMTLNPMFLDATKVYEPMEIQNQLLQNESFRIGESVSSGKNYILLPIDKGMSGFSSLFVNLQNGDQYVISSFENDMDELFPLLTFPSLSSSDSRIGAFHLDATFIYSRIAEMNLAKNPFRSSFEKLKTPKNQNPVILIYTLKDEVKLN